MLELYIFNKNNNGLSRWDDSDASPATNQISFNLAKFKAKDGSENISTELVGELNRQLKANDKLLEFFQDLSGQFELEIIDDFHHLLIYDGDRSTLILDSKIVNQLTPCYLWSFYYALARTQKTQEQIYRKMFKFFASFDHRELDAAIKELAGDEALDAGGHLQHYLKLVHKTLTERFDLEPYHATQLLRNRALAGKTPFDLLEFETISANYAHDPFSGDACQEYFDSFNRSFDKSYAKAYYHHLVASLKTIGLKTIAQRGSRVAHEQGPILVNSTKIDVDEEFELGLRKARSQVIEAVSKLEDASSKFFKLAADFGERDFEQNELKDLFDSKLLNINLDLDNFFYLAQSKSPRARFTKAVKDFAEHIEDYASSLIQAAKAYDKEHYINFYEAVRQQEAKLVAISLELETLLENSAQSKAHSVIYIQRPSSRSGHFIPRILLGQKLYIETDKGSEQHRLEAIPFNFVCPDFNYVAAGLDAFFENASISVVTDRQTGKPDIKWENAEDLAISLAPGMYQAIKAAQDQG
ncbi:MAG: hypothetical protein OXU45_04975, partial [Candidatus Melainabacteria bacterium]|nr:hypothetical protein [Candidatus Melainabacteria bacterium]